MPVAGAQDAQAAGAAQGRRHTHDRVHRSADHDRHPEFDPRNRRRDRRQHPEGQGADVPDQEELSSLTALGALPLAAAPPIGAR